jgi:pyridoxamine 5'-phosphate oxidase
MVGRIMVNRDLKDIRREYSCSPLKLETALECPVSQFEHWFSEISASPAELDKTAMLLTTIDKNGFPDPRIVLLKEIDNKQFVFYTNYQSTKGQQLASCNKAALTFYWPSVCRQVRVKGVVQKVSKEKSDHYFKSRPRGSQIGAIVSKQSEKIASREQLEEAFLRFEEQAGEDLTRPEHWGGYALTPLEMEFWQGRNNRLHDRILYQKNPDGAWETHRLQP